MAPFAQEVKNWHQEGIRGTTIHDALVREYAFTGSYFAVRRFLQGLPDHHPKATVILDIEPREAARVDFGTGLRITDAKTGEVIPRSLLEFFCDGPFLCPNCAHLTLIFRVHLEITRTC